jgi:hypothetical protein
VTEDDATAAVVQAAISWHVHHSPVSGPADNSAAAGRARERLRADTVQQLHAAVAALLASSQTGDSDQ